MENKSHSSLGSRLGNCYVRSRHHRFSLLHKLLAASRSSIFMHRTTKHFLDYLPFLTDSSSKTLNHTLVKDTDRGTTTSPRLNRPKPATLPVRPACHACSSFHSVSASKPSQLLQRSCNPRIRNCQLDIHSSLPKLSKSTER